MSGRKMKRKRRARKIWQRIQKNDVIGKKFEDERQYVSGEEGATLFFASNFLIDESEVGQDRWQDDADTQKQNLVESALGKATIAGDGVTKGSTDDVIKCLDDGWRVRCY